VWLEIGIAAVLAAGFIGKKPLLLAAVFIPLVTGHAWRYSTMIAHVEGKFFDGMDSED